MLSKWFNKYSDDVRHPLIVENPDWDEINVVLAEWVDALTKMSTIDSLTLLRVIVEIVYVMGYDSGKKNKGA